MSGTFQVPREAIEPLITTAPLASSHGREPQFQIGESVLLSMSDSNYIPTLQQYLWLLSGDHLSDFASLIV